MIIDKKQDTTDQFFQIYYLHFNWRFDDNIGKLRDVEKVRETVNIQGILE